MGKLYYFGIGGTGSRVLKSLLMLLSAGVKLNATEVVPIIIDPDKGAADMARTADLVREYQQLPRKLLQLLTKQMRIVSLPLRFHCVSADSFCH